MDWETEEEIASFFRENYIQKQRYCPAALVKGKIEQYVFEKHGEEFVAGRTYIKNFLKRHNLSLRTPHVRRRTAPDDKKVAEFLMDVECACEQFTDDFIYNVDETCWRLVNGRMKTLANRGQE